MKNILQSFVGVTVFAGILLFGNQVNGQNRALEPIPTVHNQQQLSGIAEGIAGQTARHGGDSVHRKGLMQLTELADAGQTTRHGGDSVHRKGLVQLTELADAGQTTRHGGDSVHRKGLVQLTEFADESQTTRHGGDSVHRKGLVQLTELADAGQTARHGGDSVHRKSSVEMLEFVAWPNPAVGTTRVSVVLPEQTHTTLEVFSLQGQRMATIFEGVSGATSRQSFDYDASSLSNGVYLLRLSAADGRSACLKLVVRN